MITVSLSDRSLDIRLRNLPKLYRALEAYEPSACNKYNDTDLEDDTCESQGAKENCESESENSENENSENESESEELPIITQLEIDHQMFYNDTIRHALLNSELHDVVIPETIDPATTFANALVHPGTHRILTMIDFEAHEVLLRNLILLTRLANLALDAHYLPYLFWLANRGLNLTQTTYWNSDRLFAFRDELTENNQVEYGYEDCQVVPYDNDVRNTNLEEMVESTDIQLREFGLLCVWYLNYLYDNLYISNFERELPNFEWVRFNADNPLCNLRLNVSQIDDLYRKYHLPLRIRDSLLFALYTSRDFQYSSDGSKIIPVSFAMILDERRYPFHFQDFEVTNTFFDAILHGYLGFEHRIDNVRYVGTFENNYSYRDVFRVFEDIFNHPRHMEFTNVVVEKSNIREVIVGILLCILENIREAANKHDPPKYVVLSVGMLQFIYHALPKRIPTLRYNADSYNHIRGYDPSIVNRLYCDGFFGGYRLKYVYDDWDGYDLIFEERHGSPKK